MHRYISIMDLSMKKPGTSSDIKENPIKDKNDSVILDQSSHESPSTHSKIRKFEEDEQPVQKIHVEGIGAVVASHYNNIEEKGLSYRSRSAIFFMRNFNNWVKSILIDQFVTKTRGNNYGNFTVLDLGCGKGGDIFKWKKNFVKHVIFTDIADSTMTQCKDRYISQKKRCDKLFSAEFIVADFSRTRLKEHFRNREQKLDFVSCQFALHYAFESLAQAEQVILNISENLRSGGHFITTLPNAYKIMAASQKQVSGSDKNEISPGRNNFGNDVFKITFNHEDENGVPPLFGDKYHFNLEGVVDCPEFLVHLPTLVRICQKYDLECVYVEDFQDIFETYNKDRFYLQLLHKMNCLEQIHKNGDYDSKEFLCAERYLARSGKSSILTLSASEWEATCLYLAVGFRKK